MSKTQQYIMPKVNFFLIWLMHYKKLDIHKKALHMYLPSATLPCRFPVGCPKDSTSSFGYGANSRNASAIQISSNWKSVLSLKRRMFWCAVHPLLCGDPGNTQDSIPPSDHQHWHHKQNETVPTGPLHKGSIQHWNKGRFSTLRSAFWHYSSWIK